MKGQVLIRGESEDEERMSNFSPLYPPVAGGPEEEDGPGGNSFKAWFRLLIGIRETA